MPAWCLVSRYGHPKLYYNQATMQPGARRAFYLLDNSRVASSVRSFVRDRGSGVLYVILLYYWCHNCHNTPSDHWCHLHPLTRGHDGMCEGCDGGPDNVTLFTRTPRVFLITNYAKKPGRARIQRACYQNMRLLGPRTFSAGNNTAGSYLGGFVIKI